MVLGYSLFLYMIIVTDTIYKYIIIIIIYII